CRPARGQAETLSLRRGHSSGAIVAHLAGLLARPRSRLGVARGRGSDCALPRPVDQTFGGLCRRWRHGRRRENSGAEVEREVGSTGGGREPSRRKGDERRGSRGEIDRRRRALAVTSARRAVTAPEIPTIAEAALPGFDAATWFALVAPAGTPRDIVRRLNTEV